MYKKAKLDNDTSEKSERLRLIRLNAYERAARKQGFNLVAGVDEAGRGPLAGPVVAAACVIPKGVYLPGVNDSKQLSSAQRDKLFTVIKNHSGISYGIGMVSSEVIDEINIYQATILAMLQAIEKLVCIPDAILVDGLKLPHPTIPCEMIIKGDTKSQSIAAASIIAKETRDHLMREYHAQWPHYGFDKHKGYATAYHLDTLAKHGPCSIHRKSFAPIKNKGKQACYQSEFDFN